MKFDINNYKGEYAMHCVTEEEAREFCNYLHSVGKRWWGGMPYPARIDYDVYYEDTVYFFNKGTFADVEDAREAKYTILEFSDFDWPKEFTKADLKTGDVILLRNGNVEIVNRELEMFICQNGNWDDFNDYKENLKCRFYVKDKKYDIMQVRRPQAKYECSFSAFEKELGTLVYERKEPEEMTLAEVCKLLGKEIKIIP